LGFRFCSRCFGNRRGDVVRITPEYRRQQLRKHPVGQPRQDHEVNPLEDRSAGLPPSSAARASTLLDSSTTAASNARCNPLRFIVPLSPGSPVQAAPAAPAARSPRPVAPRSLRSLSLPPPIRRPRVPWPRLLLR